MITKNRREEEQKKNVRRRGEKRNVKREKEILFAEVGG